MTEEEFCQTDKIIFNYFVPFTSGKFIASCLSLSPDVYSIFSYNELISRLNNSDWPNVEYSDTDLWWKDHRIDWFHSKNWFSNLTSQTISAVANNQYLFYTCHEDYTVRHLQSIFPNSRVLAIIPDLELCRQNYTKRNWASEEINFKGSRVQKEFDNFKPILKDLVINQIDLYDEPRFITFMGDITEKLKISIDMDLVLTYRQHYLARI